MRAIAGGEAEKFVDATNGMTIDDFDGRLRDIGLPVDAVCQAWRNLIARPDVIASIGMRDWPHFGRPQ